MAADPNCKTTKRKGHRDENEELEDRLFCGVRGHDERERPCSTERNGYELDADDMQLRRTKQRSCASRETTLTTRRTMKKR